MPLDQPLAADPAISAVMGAPLAPGSPELDWLEDLDPGTRRQLATALGEYLLYEKLADYAPYPRQAVFHAAGATHLNRLLRAGNQNGKTWCASNEVAMHVVGEYPPWWIGRRFAHPIVCWVTGDALPNETPIPGPGGARPIGRLRPGDRVFGQDGLPTEVKSVYPQGRRMTWTVTLSDGTTVDCDKKHLWTLRSVNRRSGRRGKWETVRLQELLRRGFEREKYELPPRPVVEFDPQGPLPVEPYLYGLLLGDGRIDGKHGKLEITTMDPSIVRHCREEAARFGLSVTFESAERTGQAATWRISRPRGDGTNPPNRLMRALKKLGAATTAPFKRINPHYLTAPSHERIALLQGLMDTDGTIDKRGSMSFSSSSKGLAEDVRRLAHSLGINANLGPHNTTWRVTLWQTPEICPFRVARKRNRWHAATRRRKWPKLFCIESAAPAARVDCTCITVSAANGLFLAGDFVPTHNTAESVRDLGQTMLFGPAHALGTGTIPKRCLTDLIKYSKAVSGLIDFARVRHAAGGTSLVRFRYYEQKRTAWQGPSVHVLWWDEEPPDDKYEEGLARTMATGGITLMTYTPVKGRTEVTRRYIEEKGRPASYHDTLMTIHDAHHMTPAKIAVEKARWPEWQWGARLYGEPMAGEGQIYPVLESDITCKPFEIPEWWPQIAGFDFGWTHPAAAVNLAWDREADIVYVTREWREAKKTPADHALTLRHWGKHLKWAWPMDGNRVYDKDSGAGYARTYREAGLKFMMTHAQYPEIAGESGTKRSRISVERGISDILDRMQTGRLKAFDTCRLWHSERRLYHRVKGKIHEEEDDLMDATRVAIMALRFAQPPRPPARRSRRRPPNWRAS